MQAATRFPIVVVGGGIGGLATALALEQAPVFKEIGAGIQPGANVMRMFSILGITGDILPLAVFPTGLMIRD